MHCERRHLSVIADRVALTPSAHNSHRIVLRTISDELGEVLRPEHLRHGLLHTNQAEVNFELSFAMRPDVREQISPYHLCERIFGMLALRAETRP